MKIIKAEEKNAVDLACEFLRAGKIISFATDTVYGIAVDAGNTKAVDDLYKIKNRDEKKPIAIFVKDLNSAKKIFFFDEVAEKIANKFLPGSLTLVLKTKAKSSFLLAKNLNKNSDGFLGFRIIDNEFIQNLFTKFDGILAVTSANKSNKDAALNADEVKKYFANSNLGLLVDGGQSAQQIPSTVVKIVDEKIIVLRAGAIPFPTEF